MNPALMALYLDQNGRFDQQGYNNNLMDQYYQSMGMQPPKPDPNMAWLDNYKDLPVPGTRGAVTAPQLPKPKPVQQPMTPEEEYAQYGTIHGITPDPNSNYDMAPTSPAPPGSEGYMGGADNSNPIANGAKTAMQAARASYDIDEEQKRRALGVAMVKFFSNYAASDNPSRLGALNESFNPAIDAFISERDKSLRHNVDEKKRELDEAKDKLDMEYKMAEHKRKMGQAKFAGMTVAQQQAVKDKLITRAFKIEERKTIELDNYVKNHLQHVRGSKKEEAIAKRKAEIDAKWKRQEDVVRKEMQHYGLEPEDLVPTDPTAAAPATVTPSSVTTSATSAIAPGGVPNSELSIAELQAKLAALKAQGR